MSNVKLKNVFFSYHNHQSVQENNLFSINDISFTLRSGSFLSILGPNGSGKSTLLRLINKLITPDSGTIEIFDKNYLTLTRKDLSVLIAFVPQIQPQVFPYTVFEMVLMGRSPHLEGFGFEKDSDKKIAEDAMIKTDIYHLRGKTVHKLSGGELQRVFLARALAQQSPILILDEANTHLDLKHQVEIFTLIKNIVNKNNISVISVFHDLNLASLFSDEILLLKNGRIKEYGNPKAVLTKTTLQEVFGTEVIIDQHPTLNTPRITINIENNFLKKHKR